MKHFIYLDTDIVSSIIAQAEKGYITQQTIEEGSGSTQTKDKSHSSTAEIGGSGGFLRLLQTEAKVSIEGEVHSANAVQSSTRELKEKILHDAAFDVAYEYIKPLADFYGIQDGDKEGNYLEIKRDFNYVDFDYLEGLFQRDGFVELLKKSSAEKIENQVNEFISTLNHDQLRKTETKIKTELKKATNLSNKQYDELASYIRAFRTLIPYSRMLISDDGYLIPLDDMYFRINPSSLGFKYGGEMTCVGMVTNIIGEDTNPSNSKNFFASTQSMVNNMLMKILPTKENNLCVLHPIAVYYGE